MAITTTTSQQRPPRLDRWFWLALLLAAAVVVPRNLLITAAHSPTIDEQGHLRHGLATLTRCDTTGVIGPVNDGPLGDVICAVPLWAVGCRTDRPMNPATMPPHPLASEDPRLSANVDPERVVRARATRHQALFGHAYSPDAVLLLVAAWKAILFLPAAGLVFHWCRRLYGPHAGWLSLALLLIDPTLAAQLPLATGDVPALEAGLFACYFAWRSAEHPRRRGLLIAAACFTALAVMIKLTTLVIPAVAVLIGVLFLWRRDHFAMPAVRRWVNWCLAGVLLTCLLVWALTGFDFSSPAPYLSAPGRHAPPSFYNNVVYPALFNRWPAGSYVVSLVTGVDANLAYRWGYLLGQSSRGGWWYYFPVVAAYKVPLGFFVVVLVALFTLRRRPPRFDEWSLALPLAVLLGMFLFLTHINTGFRHFLPAYVFVLMLAGRAVVGASWVRAAVVWAAVVASAVDTLRWHPDYMSYFNRPVEKPWLICNDSNVDWGQGLKQVRRWLDEHPTDRPVYLRYDWEAMWVDYYLGPRVHRLELFQPVPDSGLLIICPVWEAGYWDPTDAYAFLRPERPIDVVGHSMPVYDLDAIRRPRTVAPSNGPR